MRVSRELMVGLVTALLAVAATVAALWLSTPRRAAVPDVIELRVAEPAGARPTPAASASDGAAGTPRSRHRDDRTVDGGQLGEAGDDDRDVGARGDGDVGAADRASRDSAPAGGDDGDDGDDDEDGDDDNGDDGERYGDDD